MKYILKINICRAASLLTTVSLLAYLLTTPSCANQGMGPDGGPKDTIPPKVLQVVPSDKQINFSGNQIEVSFDEYVSLDNIAQKLVVSPPLAEKPTIRTKGKSISVKFNEDLIPTRTYSVDFQNSIKDYNEGNKLESLRMLFSTYEKIDTLRISGYLLDAFTLEPVENAYATLYSIHDDSVFSSLKPDYISRANDKGFFLFDNLVEGEYRLFGLVDSDNNLKYTSDLEKIAFFDSVLSPKTIFVDKLDTLIKGSDTIVSRGYLEYFPKDVFPRMFVVDKFNQYIASNKREKPDFIQLVFLEQLNDDFAFEIVNPDSALAKSVYLEIGQKRDTVSIWLTDQLLINNDSLFALVRYNVLDSMQNVAVKSDTIKVFHQKQRQTKGKTAMPKTDINQNFQLKTNASQGVFDYFLPLYIETPSPTTPLSIDNVHIAEIKDSVETHIPFELKLVDNSSRKYLLEAKLNENTSYKLRVDSASVFNSLQVPNAPMDLSFKTQKADFYGSLILDISSLDSPIIIQILKNSKGEEVDREFYFPRSTTTVKLEYLKPGKYKVKLIVDSNENLKWDTGNYSKLLQPEMVFYFSKIVEIRSNWELKEQWSIDLNALPKKEFATEKEKQ